MHISLSDDLKYKLKPFAQNRQMSMSGVVRVALEKLFQSEDVDPHSGVAIKAAIDSKFVIPANWPYSIFLAFLYMLSENYSNESSKAFWGPIVYRSSLDKTHKDILIEVKEEASRVFKAQKNGSLEG